MFELVKRVGVVDAGSNSFLLLIAEKTDGGVKYILDRALIVEMGKLLHRTDETIVKRAKDAITLYHRVMDEYGVLNRVMVGTEIFRKLPKSYFSELGEGFDRAFILSGEEEARLSYLSVAEDETLSVPSPLVVDIGGGSVEYSYMSNGESEFKSLPIGARVLTDKFVRRYPIENQLEKAKEYVEKIIGTLPHLPLVLIGGSGTTLAALVKKAHFSNELHGTCLKRDEIESVYSNLCTLSLKKISELKGMESGREEIIAAGVLVILKSMELSHNENVVISVRGHRYTVAKKILMEGGEKIW